MNELIYKRPLFNCEDCGLHFKGEEGKYRKLNRLDTMTQYYVCVAACPKCGKEITSYKTVKSAV